VGGCCVTCHGENALTRLYSGDNEKPFAKLASSLKLPQTAYLALQGPLVVPLLDDHEREWWNETDMMGMSKQASWPFSAVVIRSKDRLNRVFP
jgi:hypothetical protein